MTTTTSAHERRAYTVQEFCAAFHIGRTTVYREIQDGNLKTFKVRGWRRMIAAEDADAWLAKCKAEAGTA